MMARALLVFSLAVALAFGAGCSRKSAGQATAKWQDAANWKQLRPGMPMDQVRTVLGEPAKVRSDPAFTDLHYNDSPSRAMVTFAGGVVKSWSEP